MASERTRRALAAAGLVALACIVLAPLRADAATPTPRPVPASEPWWVRVAFAGHVVTEVRANGDTIAASVSGVGQQESTDGGSTWQPIFERHGLVIPPGPSWRIIDGRVAHADTAAGTWQEDATSPAMVQPHPGSGDQRGLLAAPASAADVPYVVAVDRDNVVWRRDPDGHWERALLLLPQHLAAGPPQITALVAFDSVPLSDTVYMATLGYSVLISADGGTDWIRASPGLPDNVNTLYADPVGTAVYAGTDDGLWVHHLRSFPQPPQYHDADLRWRLLGIALVTVAGSALAVAGLLRAVR